MSLNLEELKKVKGMKFGGIYQDVLLTNHYKNNEISIICKGPLLSFQTQDNEFFWLLEWEETHLGDDILFVYEQETPHPLNYERIKDQPYQKYGIAASNYTISETFIKNVYGYGDIESTGVRLTSIVLELDNLYLHIITGPVIEIIVKRDYPVIQIDELIVSTE